MSKEAFGPNLRRQRIQRGISLEQIAEHTKVNLELWEGLERNDFARWPSGIFARAYVRAYAMAIDVDPESTVNEFCRWFPQGDRRARPLIGGQAEIIGHPLEWHDQVPPSVTAGDRRAPPPREVLPDRRVGPFAAFGQMFGWLRRPFGRA